MTKPIEFWRDADHDDDTDHDVFSNASETSPVQMLTMMLNTMFILMLQRPNFYVVASETQPILMLTGPQAGFQQQQQPPAPGQGMNS